MAKVLVKANVAYPDELVFALEAFDRTQYGEIGYAIELDDDAHNQVYVAFKWDSLPRAKHFWTSDIGLSHASTWNSVTSLEFVYLRTLRDDDLPEGENT